MSPDAQSDSLPHCGGARNPVTGRGLGICCGCPLRSGKGGDIDPPAVKTSDGYFCARLEAATTAPSEVTR